MSNRLSGASRAFPFPLFLERVDVLGLTAPVSSSDMTLCFLAPLYVGGKVSQKRGALLRKLSCKLPLSSRSEGKAKLKHERMIQLTICDLREDCIAAVQKRFAGIDSVSVEKADITKIRRRRLGDGGKQFRGHGWRRGQGD